MDDLIRDIKSKLSLDNDDEPVDSDQVKITHETKPIMMIVDDPALKHKPRKVSDDFDLNAANSGRKRNYTFNKEGRPAAANFIDLLESKTKDLAMDLGLMDDVP